MTTPQRAMIAKLIVIELELGTDDMMDGQSFIRSERLKLESASSARIRVTETKPEFARRKSALIKRRMDEAKHVASLWGYDI